MCLLCVCSYWRDCGVRGWDERPDEVPGSHTVALFPHGVQGGHGEEHTGTISRGIKPVDSVYPVPPLPLLVVHSQVFGSFETCLLLVLAVREVSAAPHHGGGVGWGA